MLPDWSDSAAYPSKLSNDGWAWEFLRRNRTYLETWKDYQNCLSQLTAKYGPVKTWSAKIKANNDVWHFSPPIRPQETYQGWLRRVLDAGGEPLRTPLKEGRARRWGLVCLLDPALPASAASPKFIRRPPHIWYDAGDIYELDRENAPKRFEVAFPEIDLLRPLDAQLRDIKSRLRARQRQIFKSKGLSLSKHSPKMTRYRNFLRVHDAFHASPKPSIDAIAKAIGLSGHADAKKTLAAMEAQAEVLIQGGYRSLIY